MNLSFLFGDRSLPAQIDTITFSVVIIILTVAAGVAILIVSLSLKYHHGQEVDRTPGALLHGAIGPLGMGGAVVALLGLYFAGARLLVRMNEPPANAMPIYVMGREWMWKLQHSEGRQEINELHIPVRTPVKLIMTSQDVVHSFYLPAFRIHQDVLPGRSTVAWFEADETGTYRWLCGEYCGTFHAGMTGRVIVMPAAGYQQWLSGAVAPAAAPVAPSSVQVTASNAATGGKSTEKPLDPAAVAAGAKLFDEFTCATCHKADGTGKGPSLQGVFGHTVHLEGGKTVLADEAYLRESLLQPNAKIVNGYKPEMPSFQGQMEDAEFEQVMAYLKSLGKSAPVTKK